MIISLNQKLIVNNNISSYNFNNNHNKNKIYYSRERNNKKCIKNSNFDKIKCVIPHQIIKTILETKILKFT